MIISLIAGLFLLIGLLPFLGWLNWFTTLPAAALGAIVSGVAMSRLKRGPAVAGFVISLAIFAVALVRLFIGGGII